MEELVPLSQEPIRHIGQVASAKHADWSYERLAVLRGGAIKERDSGFLWTHERTHPDEIIEHIEATARLKRERDAYQASKKKRCA